MVINFVTVIYETSSSVISFVLVSQIKTITMKWEIAMFGGMTIVCIVNYFVHARQEYKTHVVHASKEAYKSAPNPKDEPS